jgi:hypothetical protein
LVDIVDIVAWFVGTAEWEEEHSYFPGTRLKLALVAFVGIGLDCYLVAGYCFELILIVAAGLFEC